MNRKEWKEFCKTNSKDAFIWYNRVRKLLKSKEFESSDNCDKDAKVIHHLRDTEEQRKYNDEHYELFGFEIDEDGNEIFNYGKYVVFWTKEHHDNYHRKSLELRLHQSKVMKEKFKNYDYYKAFCEVQRNKWTDKRKEEQSIRCKLLYEEHPEIRQKISNSCKGKCSGENNAMYGKFGKDHPKYGHTMTDEGKANFRAKRLHHEVSADTRKKISISLKNSDKHPWRGRHLPDYIIQKISDTKKSSYHPYRGNNLSEEHRNNISKSLLGHITSESTKKKISDSLKGHIVSEDTRKKISNNRKGKGCRPCSEDTKKKISYKKKYISEIYNKYKFSGGSLSWNIFNKYFHDIYNSETCTFNLEFVI